MGFAGLDGLGNVGVDPLLEFVNHGLQERGAQPLLAAHGDDGIGQGFGEFNCRDVWPAVLYTGGERGEVGLDLLPKDAAHRGNALRMHGQEQLVFGRFGIQVSSFGC